MPPPPPPAPGPPPPGKMPAKASGGRKQLLGSIEGFSKGKLKKTKTVDKSAPITPSPSTASRSNDASNSSTTSSNNTPTNTAPMMAMGGLFAGGIPTLRKTGRPGAATMLNTSDKPVSSPPVQKETSPVSSTPIVAKTETESPKLDDKPLPQPPSKPKEVETPKVVPVTPVVTPPIKPVVQSVSTPAPQINTVIQPTPVSEPVKQPNVPTLQHSSSFRAPKLTTTPSGTSILPKLSYSMDFSMIDDLEAHPSIPSYHNPVKASLQSMSVSSSNINLPEVDVPEEEPLPEFETLELKEDIPVVEPLVVETMNINDTHQPKAACELLPKRQQLLKAAREDDVDTIMALLQEEPTQMRRKELLNGLAVDAETNKKTSALHQAIEYGNLSMVATLISQGSNTLMTDAAGDTAIHTVCKTQHPSTMEIFNILIQSSCNVKAQNQAGNTPLHVACMLNDNKFSVYPEMVYTLVVNPFAELLIQNSQGLTALMYAAQSGDIGVVKLILSRLSPGDALKLLNMSGKILTQNGPRVVNAVSIASDRKTVGEITKLLIEYGGEASPKNLKQSSLGPLLCRLSVPPINYPSNRIARLLQAGIPSSPSDDADALTCLECGVQFGMMTRRHHCRSCGMVYCSKCSATQLSLPSGGKPARVCNVCAKNIRFFSPLQLVSSKFFIQRESCIYRKELEQYHDEAVSFTIERFDNESEIVNLANGLPKPTWRVQENVKKMKLEAAFTVSKLPTQSHLPEEGYCSLFEFAALVERLRMISDFCLDIHDIIDQEEISLDSNEPTNVITLSQQKAAVFILLAAGAQIYSLMSRMSESSPLYKFLDSSYHKMRLILQFMCELKPCSDKQDIEFSFDVVEKYNINPAQAEVKQESVPPPPVKSAPAPPPVAVVAPIVEEPSIPTLADIEVEPLPDFITKDPEPEETKPEPVAPTKGGLLSKLFTKQDSKSDIKEEQSKDSDIESEEQSDEEKQEEETVKEAPKSGFFSSIFKKSETKDNIKNPLEDSVDEENDIPAPPPPAAAPPPPPGDETEQEETKVEEESSGFFSKLFKRKNEDKEAEPKDELLDNTDFSDEENEEPAPEPEEIQTEEEQPKKKLFGFFSRLKSSSSITEEVVEEVKEEPEISEDDKEKETDKKEEKPSKFSWFRRKKVEETTEEKPEEPETPTMKLPAPSPDLDLEEDELVLPPKEPIITPTESKPEEIQKPLPTPPVKPEQLEEESTDSVKEESSIETVSSGPNLMSEMKSKLSGIKLAPPVSIQPSPIIKKDPLDDKPLPSPAAKSDSLDKPLPTPLSKPQSFSTPQPKKTTPKPPPKEEKLPEVENNLFGADDDDDDLFGSSSSTTKAKEEKPISITKPVEQEKPKESESKPSSSLFGESEESSSLFGDSVKEESKPLKEEPKPSSSLFGESSTKEETKPTVKVNIEKEESTSLFGEPEKMESSLFKEEPSSSTSLFGDDSSKTKEKEEEDKKSKTDKALQAKAASLFGDDDELFTIPSKPTKIKESEKPKELPKETSSGSLFDDIGDDLLSISSKPKKSEVFKKKESEPISSSLFDFNDDIGENSLFVSSKTSKKPPVTRKQKSNLFEDTDDLFNF